MTTLCALPLASLVVLGVGAAMAFYEDDVCTRAEWQCALGGFGLFTVAVVTPLAVVVLIAAGGAWLFYWLEAHQTRRRK